MLRRWLSGLILVATIPQTSPAATFSCYQRFKHSQTVSQTRALYRPNFNYDSFSTTRASFEQALRSGQDIDVSTISDAAAHVAFVEAVSRVRGVEVLNLDSILRGGSVLQKYHLQRLVSKLDFSNGLSISKTSELLEDLYLLSHSVALSEKNKRSLRSVSEDVSLKATIRKRIESEIVKTELLTAFQNLGLVRDRTTLAKMARWRYQHRGIEDAFLTGLLNFISIHYLSLVSYIPDANLKPMQKPPVELIEKIKNGGFDSVYDEIRPYYKKTTIFNSVWNAARVAYATYFMAYGSMMAIQAMPAFSNLVNSTTVPVAQLERLQQQTFNASEVRQQQFESWKDAFFEFEGRWPDPIRDKAEWERNWNSIMNTSDDLLRVHYRPL